MYELRLYVTGRTPNSMKAVSELKALLEKKIPGRYALQVIDVLNHQADAEADRIIATPTVIRISPSPPVRIIGDLSARTEVSSLLGISAD